MLTSVRRLGFIVALFLLIAFGYIFSTSSIDQHAKETETVLYYQLSNLFLGETQSVQTSLSPNVSSFVCGNKNCNEEEKKADSLQSASIFKVATFNRGVNFNLPSVNNLTLHFDHNDTSANFSLASSSML